jgi:hypothetical protein
MSERPDGNAISHWWAIIDAAAQAKNEAEVNALVEKMDGWPTIIDVDDYAENDDVRDRFTSEVARVERLEEEARAAGRTELSAAYGGLVSMLTST